MTQNKQHKKTDNLHSWLFKERERKREWQASGRQTVPQAASTGHGAPQDLLVEGTARGEVMRSPAKNY